MAKIGLAIGQLHDSLTDLSAEYRKVGQRHPSDHDVFHICRRLSLECSGYAQQVAAVAGRFGKPISGGEEPEYWQNLLGALRRKTGAIAARTTETGLLLLRDLRDLYLTAQECEINWTIVHQAAQAVRDAELVELTADGIHETSIQVKWLKTRLKLAAPQVLAVG
jgi:hypothetical protein